MKDMATGQAAEFYLELQRLKVFEESREVGSS